MAAVIKTVNLTKRYGTLVALSNLNLEINEGDCFGFIGPNGAGKTTTIKILATLLQPTWGEARICDFVVGYQSRQIRPLIGYVPDYFGAYEDMVVQEYLEFFAAAYNINGPARTKIVNDVLELTDLGYKVLKARDADNALVILDSGIHVDLLFTDVVLPGTLRSPDLAKIARQRLPNIAVLFTSGYTDNAIVHGGRLDPGVELLSKPSSQSATASPRERKHGIG